MPPTHTQTHSIYTTTNIPTKTYLYLPSYLLSMMRFCKTGLQQGIDESGFYGDLVNKFKKSLDFFYDKLKKITTFCKNGL